MNATKTGSHTGSTHCECEIRRWLLGHLEKGGHFNVEQRELLPGQWDLTFIEVDMKGKALFFKTIAVEERDFRTASHRGRFDNSEDMP